MFNKIKVVALMLLLLLGNKLMAVTEPYQQKIQGALKKGDTLLLKDEKFQNAAYDWKNITNNNVLNTITFGLRKDTVYRLPKPFSGKLDLKVEYWSSPDQDMPITIEHVKLDINYDTTAGANYQETAQYTFRNAYKVKITVNDFDCKALQPIPPVFFLNAEVVIDRSYLNIETTRLGSGGMMRAAAIDAGTTVKDHLRAMWAMVAGTVTYDLEWTYIDETSANGKLLTTKGSGISIAELNEMFRHNATRINTSVNYYDIPMIQEHQYLLVRSRHVIERSGYRDEAVWNYNFTINGQAYTGVAGTGAGVKWYIPGMNWQYTASYSEEGKRKEVVSFLDGSLRNRQSVTLLSTTGTPVIQESVFDKYGRVVGNVLPAPVNATTLQYYPGQSLNTAGAVYSWKDIFQGAGANCIGRPALMNTSAGAARYYSPQNDIPNDNFAAAIPDAEKLPLSVTTYTPDNTGRVSMQSGVGPTLQPDNTNLQNNHTTRNYYGKPQQWELDRVFGNDVGYASHYLKNLVIDPNGQVAVSYVDDGGKTIATALAGSNSNEALLPLPNTPVPKEFTSAIIIPENFVWDQTLLKLSATSTYLSSMPNSTATFSLSVPYLIKKYQENNVTICSNCYYELKVRITDDCNNVLVEDKGVTIGSALPDCNVTGAFSKDYKPLLANVGAYNFVVELALNPNVIEAFTDDFIKRNTNLKTQLQFLMEELNRENFGSCFDDCKTCRDNLGAKADFVAALLARLQFDGVDVAKNQSTFDSWANGLYDNLYASCLAKQAACLPSPCDRLRDLLRLDVSPGGQYALFDGANNPLETDINVIYQRWKSVFTSSDIYEKPDGTKFSPADANFTIQDLVANWREEWADKFIFWHPEYCALQFCEQKAGAYYAWDQRLQDQVKTVADLTAVAGITYSNNNPLWLLNADPLFATGAMGRNFYEAFKNDLNNYSTNVLSSAISYPQTINTKNLSAFVDFTLYCSFKDLNVTETQAQEIAKWNNCTVDANCRVPERELQLFIQYYLDRKEYYYRLIREAQSFCQGCSVGVPVPGVRPGGVRCGEFSVFYFTTTQEDEYGPYHIVRKRIKYSGPDIADGTMVKFTCSYVIQFAGRPDSETYTEEAYFTGASKEIVFERFMQTGEYGSPMDIAGPECIEGPPSCYQKYINKRSRSGFYQYANEGNTNATSLNAESNAALATQVGNACAVKAQELATALGLNSTAKTQLENICKNGGDMTHPFGTSTVPPAKAYAGFISFEQVIKQNIPNFALDKNPWIVSLPYQYNVLGQTAVAVIGKTNPDICSKLNVLQQEQQSSRPDLSLYDFLKQKYGAAMKLTPTELSMLVKSCSNCNYLLQKDIELPIFLEMGAKGCVSGAEFQAGWTELDQKLNYALTNATDDVKQSDIYETVIANYFNYKWGFSLSAFEYLNFRASIATNPNQLLCNKPVYDVVAANPYDCMLGLVDRAVESARRRYDEYIAEVRREFKKQYINICKGVPAKADLTNTELYHHYTLYYYDLTGQLIRTVPPAGVEVIDDQVKLSKIAIARTMNAVANCTYNGPSANTDPAQALAALGNAANTANNAIEMWMYAGSNAPIKFITPAGNNTVYNYIYQYDHYLHVAFVSMSVTGGAVELSNTNEITVDISQVQPLGTLTHVVLQGGQMAGATQPIAVYVNGVRCDAVTNPPPPPINYEIVPGSVPTFTTDLSMVRQLRTYNRQLNAPEIVANAAELCTGISPAYYASLTNALTLWGRFNSDQPGSATDGTAGGGQFAPIYPAHGLTSSYAFSSLNNAVQQKTPDANLSQFWYDYLGRIILSKNAKQATTAGTYSYTKYDGLGRIIEAGEKTGITLNVGVPGILSKTLGDQVATNGVAHQITKTAYDEQVLDNAVYTQENLRKRISAVTYQEEEGSAPEQATYYTYDISGNAKNIWQKVYGLESLKQINYNYDLASGKVNGVAYQPGKPDQFLYNYRYDADNRLIESTTGVEHDGGGWKIRPTGKKYDAYNYYYLHGPLARTELGQDIQGIDYAYTINGWLKAVNGGKLDPDSDIGLDGSASDPMQHAKDVYAYTLNYFSGDYKPIKGLVQAFSLKFAGIASEDAGHSLYNGNISSSTLALSKFNDAAPVAYTYRYDALNRLRTMRYHPLAKGTTTWGFGQVATDYREDITYDANGNILTYQRNGNGTNKLMDNLTYNYPTSGGKLKSNQLQSVQDAASDAEYTADFKSMGTNVFKYDEIGNLREDLASNIQEIKWTVYGKIKQIIFKDGTGSLNYKYDVGGKRIYKEFVKNGVSEKTWYIGDAQGNTLAVYSSNSSDNKVFWREQHLYGSDRLGTWMPDMEVSPGTGNAITLWGQANRKRYELKNHLGNVLATVSETLSGTEATVFNQNDYAPFGSLMPGRKYSLGNGYRYGFNGKENDNEVKGEGNQQDYGMRVYDPRIAKFLSVDPLTQEYPWYTPYQFAGNKPIKYIDRDGAEELDPDKYYNKSLPAIKTMYAQNLSQLSSNEVGGTKSAINTVLNRVNLFTYTGRWMSARLMTRWMEGKGGYDILSVNALSQTNSWRLWEYRVNKVESTVLSQLNTFVKNHNDPGEYKFTGAAYLYYQQGGAVLNDLGTSLGSYNLYGKGDMTLHVNSDRTKEITGEIYFTLADKYQWKPGRGLNLFGEINHNDALKLEQIGAKPFYIRSYFQTSYRGTENGIEQVGHIMDSRFSTPDQQKNPEPKPGSGYAIPDNTKVVNDYREL